MTCHSAMTDAASDTPSQDRRRERLDRRRQEIIEAAARLFSVRGYSDTQIADIAKELAIGHGTVYRYFADKRTLFAAVIERAVSRVESAMALDAPGATTLAAYAAQLARHGEALFDL